MSDQIVCPCCGKTYKWKPALVGKRFRCRGCGEPFVIPDPQAAEQDDIQDEYELNIEKNPPQQVLAPSGKCPNCGNTLKPTAVICINCGFNLKEGKQIQTRIDNDDTQDGPQEASETSS
jgi:predicted amidophosphoribosyltransferase